jgi:hypothetical protein
MTTKILTILIVAGLVAGSAAAALQATDASLASAAASGSSGSAPSGGAQVFAVIPAGPFANSASGFTQRAPRIVVLRP